MSGDMSIVALRFSKKTIEKTTYICRQITFVKQSIGSVDCANCCAKWPSISAAVLILSIFVHSSPLE